MLLRMLKEAETLALLKSKEPMFHKQRDIIIGAYFAMLNIEDFEKGVVFDLIREDDKDYLRINHQTRIYIYDTYEWSLISEFFDGTLIVDVDKIVKETQSATKYALTKYRQLFTKHFGLTQPLNLTLLKHLRMMSLIRDHDSPELDVFTLFGYHMKLKKTKAEAQESLLLHTKGIKYRAEGR